ncbi:MAG: hypothetical protein KAI64_03130, partial [Thermoplasmata archaeon]|nr:hypothetical protein [Thermoplasmata archaeon]
LADIYYHLQELPAALFYYREALEESDGLDSDKVIYLEKRVSRLEKEVEVEQPLKTNVHGVFDIRFPAEKEAYDIELMRDILSEAYHEIGEALGHYPRHRIVVLLYGENDFERIREVPDWTGGLYDGKIRLPYIKKMKKKKELRRLVKHEYTHAVVHDLSKGKCSTWLNEGLARYMEFTGEKYKPRFLKKALSRKTLIPISEMEKSFLSIKSSARVALAYEESHSIVDFIVEEYGFWKLKRMLSHYGQGQDTQGVLRREFYVSLDQFEARWKRFLKRNL